MTKGAVRKPRVRLPAAPGFKPGTRQIARELSDATVARILEGFFDSPKGRGRKAAG